MKRVHYLDNIRWMTVLLVVVYHVFYLFNSLGVFGGIGQFSEVQYQDAVLYVIYPWFMVLLFLVAGISARYALEQKSHKEYLKSRTRKLLVPSTLGIFVLHWMSGYLYIRIGEGMESIPKFILYPICAISGIGPLWFIQMLWMFSVLLILIRKVDKQEKFYKLCGKTNIPTLLLLALLMWGSAQILNVPVITVYRFGIYFTAFLLGYFVFSHEQVQEKVEKIHIPMLVLSLLGAVAYTWHYFGENYTEDACLKSLWTNLYLWVVILAILGCMRAWGNRTNVFATDMTKVSFGIYVLHYIVTLYGCYGLMYGTALPAGMIYVIAIVLAPVLSVVLYEVVRRIPVVRFLVLGVSSFHVRK